MLDENQAPTDAEAEAAALALGVDKGAEVNPDLQTSPDPKPASDDGADDPTPEKTKVEPDKAGEEGEEAAGDGQPANNKVDDEGGQPEGVKRLLKSRNEIRIKSDTRIKELEAENAKLKTAQAEIDDEPPPADDRPITMADLDKRDARIAARAKDAQARDNLVQKMPEAEQFMELVDEMLKTHPTLTDEAALRLVAPNLFVGKSAPGNKLDAGGQARSPSKLKADKIPSQKTTVELDKEVEKMEKDGELPV